MKFKDYPYTRIDIEKVMEEEGKLLVEFEQADSFEKQSAIIDKLNEIKKEIQTSFQLAYIRNSIDTTDEFYEKEKQFLDMNAPVLGSLSNKFNQLLLESKFRKELEEKLGKYLFTKTEYELKTFSEEIIPLLQKENKLTSEYMKLLASAKIMMDGKEHNLSQMTPYLELKDREKRREATFKKMAFFEENEEKFDTIYDQLVKIRHEIAIKLGYENYVQLGYDKMGRTDYTPEDVANYRRQVYEEVVPFATTLWNRQKERIGEEDFKYYDEFLKFTTGNATPKGKEEWMIEKAKKMYKELSPETNEFFTFMTENGLLDLTAKKGKVGGGYCTFISEYKAPFIFSNFNGTSGDVDVLTHEAGHAFQGFRSRNFEVLEYIGPTSELAEVHSMSMEFFTWPWMNEFFEEDTEKYKFSHLEGAVKFVPYGVCVDEFQHFVYENPNATPAERKAEWKRLEEKYLPHRDYDGIDILERGGFWFKQSHIFAMPFYYIDYTLAQMCALQFWHRSRTDRENAWKDYIKLCSSGGSKPFVHSIEASNIKNPFVSGTIKETLKPVKEYLNSVNDKEL